MSDDTKRPAPLGRLFNPRSIAVVGASRKREKIGNIVFRNLAGTFEGELYAVNPDGAFAEDGADHACGPCSMCSSCAVAPMAGRLSSPVASLPDWSRRTGCLDGRQEIALTDGITLSEEESMGAHAEPLPYRASERTN